jgi:gamma-glutamyltranspeptidase
MQKYLHCRAIFNQRRAIQRWRSVEQPNLASTLQRIASRGPASFYEGETAAAFEKEMVAHGSDHT